MLKVFLSLEELAMGVKVVVEFETFLFGTALFEVV